MGKSIALLYDTLHPDGILPMWVVIVCTSRSRREQFLYLDKNYFEWQRSPFGWPSGVPWHIKHRSRRVKRIVFPSDGRGDGWNRMSGPDIRKTLLDKPKMFFIQACQLFCKDMSQEHSGSHHSETTPLPWEHVSCFVCIRRWNVCMYAIGILNM